MLRRRHQVAMHALQDSVVLNRRRTRVAEGSTADGRAMLCRESRDGVQFRGGGANVTVSLHGVFEVGRACPHASKQRRPLRLQPAEFDPERLFVGDGRRVPETAFRRT